MSPSPLHSLATISLTTKTKRGRLTFDFRIGIVCLFRWIPENGEMNWELVSGIPDNISACFSLYINFNRLLCHLVFFKMYNSATSGIPASYRSLTSETTMRKATLTNSMVSFLKHVFGQNFSQGNRISSGFFTRRTSQLKEPPRRTFASSGLRCALLWTMSMERLDVCISNTLGDDQMRNAPCHGLRKWGGG